MKPVKPSSKIFLLTVSRQYFLWMIHVISVLCLLLSHWYPGSGVVLDCTDS